MFPLQTKLKFESGLVQTAYGSGYGVTPQEGNVQNLMTAFPYLGIELNTYSFTFRDRFDQYLPYIVQVPNLLQYSSDLLPCS